LKVCEFFDEEYDIEESYKWYLEDSTKTEEELDKDLKEFLNKEKDIKKEKEIKEEKEN